MTSIRPRLVHWALLALLFAQFGALSHAYSHHLRQAPPRQDTQTARLHACGDCAVFGNLLQPGGTQPISLVVATNSALQRSVFAIVAAAALAPRHFFQAQAPPSRTLSA